ncbi:hypothetical protein M407DRAFT_28632 [Tulasnella calospora MUT 4182]|uniref:Uncharacterized protein n=1 Tax=Tulasnella calospora MUT 4182 TaxID=1051891 RepID=A0A0C3QBL5_9AGAM|nr:hypothetical protein M407DRAFT_28632 [Tulasnella calospora MUT 4182]
MQPLSIRPAQDTTEEIDFKARKAYIKALGVPGTPAQEAQARVLRFSGDGSRPYDYPYVDPEAQELRYCTLEGVDIPEASPSVLDMAGDENPRPMLVWAQADSLLDGMSGESTFRKGPPRFPMLLTIHHPSGDDDLKTLPLDKTLASGHLIQPRLPKENVKAPIYPLSIFGPLLETVRFRSITMLDPGRTRVQLVPYIHEGGNLRLWDKEGSQG